jgi:hypothetical protein
MKDDFVFWAKALPSRAHGAAIIRALNGTGLPSICLVHRLLMPHAGPRLGGFPALPTTDSTASPALLALKGRSGASPHQSWALQLFPLTQRLWAEALGYDLLPLRGKADTHLGYYLKPLRGSLTSLFPGINSVAGRYSPIERAACKLFL